MTSTQDSIDTSAEIIENSVIPTIHEVHINPEIRQPDTSDMPATMKQDSAGKSPARWAYERVILYIQNFEKQLDQDQEVAMGFAGSDAGVMRIEGLGYFDPDVLTFYGTNEAGTRAQLIQHVSQLSVMLTAMPKAPEQAEPNRIGFQLARDLENNETATS